MLISSPWPPLFPSFFRRQVNAARARGEILLGCGRCRYRVSAGCKDCRYKALLQMVSGAAWGGWAGLVPGRTREHAHLHAHLQACMLGEVCRPSLTAGPLPADSPGLFRPCAARPSLQRQEGLTAALQHIGCEHCSHSKEGCRHCWPAAVEAAATERASRPAEVAPPPSLPRQPSLPKEAGGKAAGGGKGGKAAAGGGPATSPVLPGDAKDAKESGVGSSSNRRNKALLAVHREAVTGAHAAGAGGGRPAGVGGRLLGRVGALHCCRVSRCSLAAACCL